VIGLRDLLPYALLPIGNALIEFDCGDGKKIKTKNSNKPNGSNPNFLEVNLFIFLCLDLEIGIASTSA
jgi:hypothetical protein